MANSVLNYPAIALSSSVLLCAKSEIYKLLFLAYVLCLQGLYVFFNPFCGEQAGSSANVSSHMAFLESVHSWKIAVGTVAAHDIILVTVTRT